MPSTTQRVKSIYSAIASPNRLEVLRILNAKGPLSYSDLKKLAGFKSKKESGKFAYHLRKLVKQSLISLNRTERKYSISSLGRLVLNLTRQIEEQSMLDSGKFYVRTSRQTMEEFNPDKILRVLTKEAGMPVELAHRITNEIESRLTKFQTIYLTAPLIREVVNALLVEHGCEEYRHKLTRLGLPTYDVTSMLNKVGKNKEGINTLIATTAKAVFSEYLLLTQMPRDISDAHLTGDIHLSNTGYWGLMPDTLFLNLNAIYENNIRLGSGLFGTPLLSPPNDLDEALHRLIMLTSFLILETSYEINYENFIPYINKFGLGTNYNDLKQALGRFFILMSSILTNSYNKPDISIQLNHKKTRNLETDVIDKTILATLEAYTNYVKTAFIPKIKLIIILNQKEDVEIIKRISQIIDSGCCLSISTRPEVVQSYSGLKKNYQSLEDNFNGISTIHSISLNLPKLSYESNKDEAYFRAKMAMLLQVAVNTSTLRRKLIEDSINRGLLSTLSQNTSIISLDHIHAVINLVGFDEAISNLTSKEPNHADRMKIIEKVIKTANKFTNKDDGNLEENITVALFKSDSAERFYTQDLEKYGKSIVISKEGIKSYSQTPIIEKEDIYNSEIIKELTYLSRSLNGGFSTTLNIPADSKTDDIEHIIMDATSVLDYFKLTKRLIMCKMCGAKFPINIKKCEICNSNLLISYSVE